MPVALLSLVQFLAGIAAPIAVLLIIVMVVSGMPSAQKPATAPRPSSGSALLVPLLVLTAIVLWTLPLLTIFVWLFVVGDSEDWQATTMHGLLFATPYAAYLCWQILRSRITKKNLIIHLCLSIILILLWVLSFGTNLSRPEAKVHPTPEEAIELYVYYYKDASDPDIIEIEASALLREHQPTCRMFTVSEDGVYRGTGTACPHEGGWRLVGWEEGYDDAAEQMEAQNEQRP